PVFRAPALSPAEFDAHWRDRHGPLALAHHVGMADYHQLVVRSRSGADAPAYDGIGCLVFPNERAFETGLFASRDSRPVIGEDTARFIDTTHLEVALFREVVLRASAQ